MPLQATLEEMAQSADHVLIGSVVGVDMLDSDGRPLTGDNERTGPGLGNVIRLIIEVQTVLVSSAADVPKEIRVPLDPMMHYSLGQIRKAHNEPSESFLLLLKGPSFAPILPGVFGRPMTEQEEAIRLYTKHHSN